MEEDAEAQGCHWKIYEGSCSLEQDLIWKYFYKKEESYGQIEWYLVSYIYQAFKFPP